MGRLNSGEEKIDSRFSKEIIHNKRNYGSFQIKGKSSANSKLNLSYDRHPTSQPKRP